MNTTLKILNIPPYISTPWKNVKALWVEARPFGHTLLIELASEKIVEIPNLDRELIEKIFAIHAKAVEEESKDVTSIAFPLPNLSGFTTMLQHNPEQKNSPLIPSEVLEKIAEITKNFLPENFSSVGQTEPDCNCPYCQVIRAIGGESVIETPPAIEETVSDEDLKFRSWDIKQDHDKVYSVTNPFDEKEHYTVFLGDPIGCTCGNNNCAHIEAVLKS